MIRKKVQYILSWILILVLLLVEFDGDSNLQASQEIFEGFNCRNFFSQNGHTTVYEKGFLLQSRKGFRINDINAIVLQISEIFDTRYFDLKNNTNFNSYTSFTPLLTKDETKLFFIKTDDFLEDFFRYIIQTGPKEKWSGGRDIDPDVTRFITLTIIKLFYQTRGRTFADIEGSLYWILNYGTRSVDDNTSFGLSLEDDIVWNMIMPDVRKKIFASMLLYYGHKVGGYENIESIEEIIIPNENENINLKELWEKDIKYKERRYKIKYKNVKQIYDLIEGLDISSSTKKDLVEKVEEQYFLNKIYKSKVFQDAVRIYPYLRNQDFSFVVKFLSYSSYREEFLAFIPKAFSEHNRLFMEKMVDSVDISDMDQIYQIGPYSFSVGEMLEVLKSNKEYNLNSKELVVAYGNLVGCIGSLTIQEIAEKIGIEIETKQASNGKGILVGVFNTNRNITADMFVELFIKTISEQGGKMVDMSEFELALFLQYVRNGAFVKISKDEFQLGFKLDW